MKTITKRARRKLKLPAIFLAFILTLWTMPIMVQAASEYTSDGATAFVFSDSDIAVTEGEYDGYKISRTDLTIHEAGTYIVSGSCADGSIRIKKGTTGVTLVLNGLTLGSADTAPIVCNKSSEVTIVAAADTINTLTDSAINNDDTYPDNEEAENAVIKCKDGSNVTICGSGTLHITANGKNGIKSGATTEEEGEASLTIRTLTLNITASVNDAINAEQLLCIESGTLTISAADDAIHCDLEMNIGATDTAGPTILIHTCYEGLEAATLRIFSGNIDITATDDCLNAANSDLTDYSFSMTISGGTVIAYSSEGDGFDSNGDLTISGGTVLVWTANTADNQPLDADGTITVSGGTILAAGGSNGMGTHISATQPYVTFGTTGRMGARPGESNDQSMTQIAENTEISVTAADGTTLYSTEAVCNVNYVFFSSENLIEGGNYTLCADGTAVMTSAAQSGTSNGDFDEQQPGMPAGNGEPPEMPNGGERPEAPGNGEPPEMPNGGERPEAPGNGEPPEMPNDGESSEVPGNAVSSGNDSLSEDAAAAPVTDTDSAEEAAPQTGDDWRVGVWIAVIGVSIGIVSAVLFHFRKTAK